MSELADNEAGIAVAAAKDGKTQRNLAKWEADARERVKTCVRKYQKPLAELVRKDVNEADTRLFVTDLLCEALGFDKYADLSTEYRIKNEYADYGIRLDNDLIAFVEVKRVNTKLGPKHLRQVQSYAVNEGVEWLVLTNGAQWQVYHLSGGLPVVTDLALEVDLLGDTPPNQKANLLFHLTRESFKRGKINDLWQAKHATSPKSFARVLLSDSVVGAIRKELKKSTGYAVQADEIVRLLSETCLRVECFER